MARLAAKYRLRFIARSSSETASRGLETLVYFRGQVLGLFGFRHGFECVESTATENFDAVGVADLARAVKFRLLEQPAGHGRNECGTGHLMRAGFEEVLSLGGI